MSSYEDLREVNQREKEGRADSRMALLALLEAHFENLASAVVEAPLLDATGELPVAHLEDVSRPAIPMKMM
jgi:hypothetical protein